ncbi:MAG TPA: GTPase [Acidimicrobiia bacterium]|nr:GTPase [Acidimicrobiia bacterium]
MHSDLIAVVDAFDRVLAATEGIIDRERLDPIAETVAQVRKRAGYLGDTLVAAVAGGTGSGKSSLINALAGEVVTESGGMRPTTGTPVAWIPANPEPGLMRLLDDLGVEDRVGQDEYPWLALLDLPDTDSVVVDHRHTVEALLPRVDLVLWVVDPEKYQDRLLHDRYLRPLAAYQNQFLFVLNQIDRLNGTPTEEMVEDLRRTLEGDGITNARVVPVAADPDTGPPVGIENLVEVLEDNLDVKRLVYEKLTTDLREAAARLWEQPELSGSVDFATRWDEARNVAASHLASGDRRQSEATLAAFVAGLAEEIGSGAAVRLRESVDETVISEAADIAYEASGAYRRTPPPPAPRWVAPVRWLAVATVFAAAVALVDAIRTGGGLLWPIVIALAGVTVWVGVGWWTSYYRTAGAERERRRRIEALVEPIGRQLDVHLGNRIREVLRQRAGATAAATELNLALAELERQLGE